PFFSPFSLGKQRQPYGLNVALATARSARRSRSKMGSPFGRNQSINARQSRSKIESPFGRNQSIMQDKAAVKWGRPLGRNPNQTPIQNQNINIPTIMHYNNTPIF
ncbi:hypothetical protein, partial [Gallibacterium anatis]